MKRILRWVGGNLGSLALAIVLAVTVWGVAVTSEDPDEVRTLQAQFPVEATHLDPNLVARGTAGQSAQITLRAPQSLWPQITSDRIHVVADLTDLGAGQHRVPLTLETDLRPVRLEEISPRAIDVMLEPPARKAMAIQVRLNGTPAAGFAANAPHWTPLQATISGSQSEVARATAVVAELNVDGLRADVDREVVLVAKDAAGETIDTLTLEPAMAEVTLAVEQQGGYRDVVVKAVIRGQVRSGYRLTGISVFPPLVTLFSTDPAAVASLPGYVETEPLDISGAQADVSGSLNLTLPANVRAVGEPVIFVQVGVAAIEDSVTVTRDVRQQGLAPGLSARLSPASVDVIVSGPVPLLKALRASDVEVYVDLAGLTPGTYQLRVSYRVLLEGVQVEALLPAQIAVTISSGAPPGS
jgi:YbbR domain-containing protein